jgi:hypothetical protein
MIKMGTDTIQVDSVILNGLDSTIYALRPRWVENALPPGEIPNFGNGHNTFDLLWYRHKGYADGSFEWDGARQVGNDWIFDQIVPASSGRIYAVEGDGDLLWYDHLGWTHGTFNWIGPRDVGDGWRIRTLDPSSRDLLGVFCDTRNGDNSFNASRAGSIIYAVRLDGTLEWFRHDGVGDGTPSWTNGGQPQTVGHGWVAGQQRVFSGCNGIIYLIADDGTLYWYKHKGYLDGTPDWEERKEVGNGWNNFHNVFSIGGGIIYAVDQDGTLWWYKHKGYQNGTPDWEERKKVGNNWKTNGFRVVCNSVYLKPTFLH